MTNRPHETREGFVQNAVQRLIRASHFALLNRGLPRKVGLYFHTLPNPDYPDFRAMVGHFRSKGYRVASSPDDFLRDDGECVLWISFDDCFRQWYTARSLFDDLDVRVTFYVNTCALRDSVDDAGVTRYLVEALGVDPGLETLSAGELNALRDDGHTIGAHTHTHTLLRSIPFEEAIADIRTNKKQLEALLGESVHHFAYPYGMRRHFNPRLLEGCTAMGFRTIARAIPALQHAGQGPVELHRSLWDCSKAINENVALISIDGSRFEQLTGRSAVG